MISLVLNMKFQTESQADADRQMYNLRKQKISLVAIITLSIHYIQMEQNYGKMYSEQVFCVYKMGTYLIFFATTALL